MPNKDLLVQAECVDIRNGKRFSKGQYFEPTPSTEQAKRLVAATCLPQGAIKLAEAEDAKLGKKAEEDAAAAEKVIQRQAAIDAAVNFRAQAEVTLDAAKAELKSADGDAAKSAAAKKVEAAELALAGAVEALEKAQK